VRAGFGQDQHRHLDAAAGIAGLIKTVMALRHRELPPSLHFEKSNPAAELENSPSTSTPPCARGRAPMASRVGRRELLRLGGTNGHAVLEEAPAAPSADPARDTQVLLLSARSPVALDAASARLAAHLKSSPDVNLADVAYTLQVGRREFEYRRVVFVVRWPRLCTRLKA